MMYNKNEAKSIIENGGMVRIKKEMAIVECFPKGVVGGSRRQTSIADAFNHGSCARGFSKFRKYAIRLKGFMVEC